MNRIEKQFEQFRQEQKKAFVAFITAGDPDLETTEALIPQLEKAGVDILELGVPFSDPMADGTVIQKSSERALKAGTTLKKILAMVGRVRQGSQIPLLLMGYYNPVLQFGLKKFFSEARKSGVDGVLLVDLPPEEAEEARLAAKAEGLSLIFLLAPTSDEGRIRKVVQKGSGFLYYVSMTGITGAKLTQGIHQQNAFRKLKKISTLPLCVGFGIKTPEQVRQVAKLADGVVVGSALVQCLEEQNRSKALKNIIKLTKNLSDALHVPK